LEPHYRRVDHGAPEVRRRCAVTQRRGSIDVGCRRVDMEAKRDGALELWGCALGVETWRCGGMER